MFTNHNRSTFGITALLVLMCTSAFAQPAPAGATGMTIEGTWIVAVDLLNPPPMLPEEFTALETYSRGGGMVTSNNIPQGPGQGSWQRSGDGYAVRIVFFSTDPNGAPAGTIVVSHTVETDGRDAYSGQGVAQVFDTDGNALGSVPFTTRGRRLTADAQ